MAKLGIPVEVTNIAKNVNPSLYNIYEKIYFVIDVNDYHILRILKGFGEGYVKDENKFILEHQLISKSKTEKLSVSKMQRILNNDDGGNNDYFVYDNIDECINKIDGGFGIHKYFNQNNN